MKVFFIVLAELIIIKRNKDSTIFNYKAKNTDFLHMILKKSRLVIKIFNQQPLYLMTVFIIIP